MDYLEKYEAEQEARRDALATLRTAARQTGKTMLFLSTPSGVLPIKPDPVAAERAKRYIWSHIERNQANDWRAE